MNNDFVAVTTRSRRKRHWAWPPSAQWGTSTLCGAGRGYTQADVDAGLANHHGPTEATITKLPPCKQCERFRQRRIASIARRLS